MENGERDGEQHAAKQCHREQRNLQLPQVFFAAAAAAAGTFISCLK